MTTNRTPASSSSLIISPVDGAIMSSRFRRVPSRSQAINLMFRRRSSFDRRRPPKSFLEKERITGPEVEGWILRVHRRGDPGCRDSPGVYNSVNRGKRTVRHILCEGSAQPLTGSNYPRPGIFTTRCYIPRTDQSGHWPCSSILRRRMAMLGGECGKRVHNQEDRR